jgi:hypothetical protein
VCRRQTKQLSWLQVLLSNWRLANTPLAKIAREITNRIIVSFLK